MGGEERNKEWGKMTEREANWFLTFSDIVAAVAVIFPSVGNKVTLDYVRTGDRRSGWLWRWHQPLLTRAGVSRGDRSKGLLTRGPWHHTAPASGDAVSAHLSTGSWNKKTGRARSYSLPSSSTVLLLYFVIPLTPMWKTDRAIKYWYDLVCLILHFAVRV